jgi:hypothetical protein
MSKNWYLTQNQDVLNSSINPLWHFIKYGRKELRLWNQPRWFSKAFKKNGWVWQNSNYFFSLGLIDQQLMMKEYKVIKVYRLGVYKKIITELKSKSKN